MKRVLWTLVLAVVPALAAQEPPDRPPVASPDSAGAERLRAEIERRFAERVRSDLGLSEDQATRLRATQERFGERRRALMRRQFEHRQGLQRQMQPGVAANADSVRVHMDALQAGRAEAVKLEQEEDQEMAKYLTPVQRARFQMMRQRLVDRVQDLRRQQERRGRVGMMGPRRGPGPRPQGQGPRRRP
ncbi:MAG: hypothetical protein ACREL9_01310 [Gemmatimonadales bacterium]